MAVKALIYAEVISYFKRTLFSLYRLQTKRLIGDGQNSLVKIDFYFQYRKYYFILYFQSTFEKYFVNVFLKYC